MSEPTGYDLTQDARLDSHDSLLLPSQVAPGGAEFSYPVVGAPLTGEQWGWIASAFGDGVISVGGMGYWLDDPDPITNTMRLRISEYTGTANAVLGGFFHQLNEPLRLAFPPVNAPTTYWLCLTYDPLLEQSPTGPIVVRVYPAAPPRTQGKKHIVLWQISRLPNDVLSMESRHKMRPRLAPTQYIDDDSRLPDAKDQMWGTTFFSLADGKVWVAHGGETEDQPSEWYDVTHGGTRDTGWINRANPDNTLWGKSTAQVRRLGKWVQWRREFIRDPGMRDNNTYNPIAEIPAQFRPPTSLRFACAANAGGTTTCGFQATIYAIPDGTIEVHNRSGAKNLLSVSMNNVGYWVD